MHRRLAPSLSANSRADSSPSPHALPPKNPPRSSSLLSHDRRTPHPAISSSRDLPQPSCRPSRKRQDVVGSPLPRASGRRRPLLTPAPETSPNRRSPPFLAREQHRRRPLFIALAPVARSTATSGRDESLPASTPLGNR
ncbi:serrate RNA effector molecule-like isoform X3 [Zingiber officinale]|uniref:serrate RNA effector molecule-like isoform X2 n=1 Tax=Zingiber officinale TaxID=94328 RepID=UPI001C4C5088|nr:serrate RNA effector molecule-like isoform X2 [Zingiber officinale]XP_042444860.1 serrate RNA effector molecule-like isoform X3 [Zingiber officinale]